MSVAQRWARLVSRHLLDGSGSSTVQAAGAVVVLHATDPATVYLSALARCAGSTLAEVAAELYDAQRLVRMMAMRRTLFVVPAELTPVVHHAASLDVAATMRRRLLKELGTATTEPALPADVGAWLEQVEAGVLEAVHRLQVASGAQLAAAEPRLRTAVLPRTDKSYDVRRMVTSQVLVLMAAEGRLVRRQPLGSWTSRQHTWEPADAAWPGGVPPMDRAAARSALAAAYLRAFGPATLTDLTWWTGWPLGVTRTALAGLDLARLEPAGTDGALVLADDSDPVPIPEPVAALLPALDPTPMGWKQRDWFLPPDPRPLYDGYGNVGPTLWWDGEVVGGWAVRPDGSVATRLLVDRGADAARAVADAAAALEPRLEGAVVVPSFRTPLERELSAAPA